MGEKKEEIQEFKKKTLANAKNIKFDQIKRTRRNLDRSVT